MMVEQVYIFLWSIITGAILGALFDFFRAFRYRGIKDIWVYIQDIIFWCVTAIIVIISSFLISEGELRGYMIIGYLLGGGFYMLTISKLVLGALRFIISGIRKILRGIISKIKSIFLKLKKSKNAVIEQEI